MNRKLRDDLLLTEEMAREVGRETAKALQPFIEEWRSTIPEGKVEPIELSITEELTVLTPEVYRTMPWRSFDLWVDGPDPVYIGVNEESINEKAPLSKGEHLEVNMQKPLVQKIILFCQKGKTSSVRIYAKH